MMTDTQNFCEKYLLYGHCPKRNFSRRLRFLIQIHKDDETGYFVQRVLNMGEPVLPEAVSHVHSVILQLIHKETTIRVLYLRRCAILALV